MTNAVPSGFCCGEEAGGGHGAGEDVLLLDVDAHAGELGDHVAPRALAVVGEKPKRDVALRSSRNEDIRAGNQLAAAVEHAVHVDQIAVLQRRLLSLQQPRSIRRRPEQCLCHLRMTRYFVHINLAICKSCEGFQREMEAFLLKSCAMSGASQPRGVQRGSTARDWALSPRFIPPWVEGLSGESG